MQELRSEIALCFPGTPRPGRRDLVVNDGFDELEKRGAEAFYAGKSWEDVLQHLRGLKDEPVFGGAYVLEEWSVLGRGALSYYLRPHLEYLLDNMSGDNPDTVFVLSLVGALYQVTFMHKGNPFSPEQTGLLRKLATAVAAAASDRDRYGDLGEAIEQNVARFLAGLG